jgi:hypothetical protein
MIHLEDFLDCKICNAKANLKHLKPWVDRDGLLHVTASKDYDHIELCDRCLKRKEIKEVKRQMGVVLMCGWNYYGTYKELDKHLKDLL